MEKLTNIKNIFKKYRKIDTKKLPSQRYFYKDDFKIWVKKASKEEIDSYKKNFDPNNIDLIINKLKHIVKNNIFLSEDYNYKDIKSVDLIYIFFEIVKFTKNKKIFIDALDENNKLIKLEFNSDNFYYFDFTKFADKWNEQGKYFEFYEYKYTIPTIGAEDDLMDFIQKHYKYLNQNYGKNFFYGFIFFANHKNSFSDDEIHNLITIFNDEIKPSEKEKIVEIINSFTEMEKYLLKDNEKKIPYEIKLNFENVWD